MTVADEDGVYTYTYWPLLQSIAYSVKMTVVDEDGVHAYTHMTHCSREYKAYTGDSMYIDAD